MCTPLPPNFYVKNKPKSEIFNDKKNCFSKMFFYVITKNLNWDILTKNLAIFKRCHEVNDKKFYRLK